MIPTITVANQSDNRTSIILMDKDEPVNLSEVTSMSLVLDNGKVIDSLSYPQAIRWHNMGTKGMVELALGKVKELNSSTNNANLLVYDEVYVKGVFFGSMRILITGGTS